jgi:hypothetical protein
MLQRIQSLHLTLTILLSVLFLTGSNFKFIDESGSAIKLAFSGIIRETGGQGSVIIEKALPLSCLIVLIPLVALITIFLFKHRKNQLRVALSGVIIAAILLVLSLYYIFMISTTYSTHIVAGLKMFVPVFILVFNILAYRGIRKDDNLVKSYDRLR